MKKYLYLVIILFASIGVNAQNYTSGNAKYGEDIIYDSVDQYPGFPGGTDGLMSYISNNLRYPDTAQMEGIEGKVVAQFVVEKDGSIGEVRITRGVHPDLNKEAIRVIKSLPKFEPGKQDGKLVRVWFTLPINFKLTSDVNETQVYYDVDQNPGFPGGVDGLMSYISNNIRYPEAAQKGGVQGRVVVQFVVEKDGSIGEAKIVRGVSPDLDKEAIRLVKSLPKFEPGKKNGKPVRTWFTLPLEFKLM